MKTGRGRVVKNPRKPRRLGDLLVEMGLITRKQFEKAVEVQKSGGRSFGQVLTDLKFCTRELLLSFLGKRCGVSYVSLAEFGAVSPEVAALVPESVARRRTLIPLRRQGTVLTVAMADPLDVFATDDLAAETGCEIRAVIAAPEEIEAAIRAHYGATPAPTEGRE